MQTTDHYYGRYKFKCFGKSGTFVVFNLGSLRRRNEIQKQKNHYWFRLYLTSMGDCATLSGVGRP
jgi:hypothetical protein